MGRYDWVGRRGRQTLGREARSPDAWSAGLKCNRAGRLCRPALYTVGRTQVADQRPATGRSDLEVDLLLLEHEQS